MSSEMSSLTFDMASPFSPRSSDCDDLFSVHSIGSSVSSSKGKFTIPSTWRPTIMDCIHKVTIEDQRRALTPSLRNEIVRDLVTSMFSYKNNPDKAFCTQAAKMLVSKYKFLEDLGDKVSGYVS